MRFIFFFTQIYKKYPSAFIASVLLLLCVAMFDTISIFTVAPVVDFLIHPDLHGVSPITQKVMRIISGIGFPATFGGLVSVFIIFNILQSIALTFVKYLILQTKYRLVKDLMCGTFEDFFNARMYFFTSTRQGTLFNTFIRETNTVADAFVAMATLLASSFQLVLYLIVPLYISWQVISISLLTALAFAVPFMLVGKISYRLGQTNTKTANAVVSVIQESLSYAKVILGFGNQGKSLDDLSTTYDAHKRSAIKLQTLGIATVQLYYPIGLIVLIVALLVSRKFAVPLAESVAVLYSLLKIIPCIGNITGQKNTVEGFYPGFEQINKLRERARNYKQMSGERHFTGFATEIAIRDVSFSYPGRKSTLSGLNMIIPKGKMVAIVGESGSGKSTLVDTILGFNEPANGQIMLDDIPLGDFDINSYRKRIGYVPQESVLFNRSILDNMLWTNENASDLDVKRACAQANADEFIQQLPQGYNTTVGDRGVRLSGGQVQRLALARAILRKPEILILDEATSSLDTQSERLIQQAIDTIAKQTTVIIIAHRLSTIANADYIYVLKRGKIIEEGNYKELLDKSGLFSRMVKLQKLG